MPITIITRALEFGPNIPWFSSNIPEYNSIAPGESGCSSVIHGGVTPETDGGGGAVESNGDEEF